MLWRSLSILALVLATNSAFAQNLLMPCQATCRDRYCEALKQKLVALNQCGENATSFYTRMSDAGYYYCTVKKPTEIALQQFERIRPPRNADESALDAFAIDTASQLLCPAGQNPSGRVVEPARPMPCGMRRNPDGTISGRPCYGVGQ